MGPCWSALLQHNLLNSSQDPDGIFLPGFEARHDPIGNPMPKGTFHIRLSQPLIRRKQFTIYLSLRGPTIRRGVGP